MYWACENGTPAGLHLYQGPPGQGLWLLRSKFDPDAQACSAYCSCTDTPTGSNLWHWMQGGDWVAQELLVQDLGAGGGAGQTAPSQPAQPASGWALSEESVPPLEPGPWDVKAAEVAAAARQAGAAKLASGPSWATSLTKTPWEDDAGIIEQVAEYLRLRCTPLRSASRGCYAPIISSHRLVVGARYG